MPTRTVSKTRIIKAHMEKARRESGRQGNPNKNLELVGEDLEKAKSVTDLNVIKKWASSTTRLLRLKAAVNPNTPKSILKTLVDDDDNQVAFAAKRNPVLWESDLEKLKSMAKSRVSTVRLRTLNNPHLTSEILNILLDDKDEEIVSKAADIPLLDDDSIDIFLSRSVFRPRMVWNFTNNKSFKKKWLSKWLTNMRGYFENDTTKFFNYLIDERFFSNEDEWFDLFSIINSYFPIRVSDDLIDIVYDVLDKLRSQKKLTKLICVAILDTYYHPIKQYNPQNQSHPLLELINRAEFCDDELRQKLFSIKPIDKFLPQAAQDIFLF